MSEAIVARVVGWDETRLVKAEGRGESQQLPEAAWADAYATGLVVEPPYDLEALAALYETNSTHKACVDAKTINIVGLGHRFVGVNGVIPPRPALKYRSGGERPSGTREDGETLTPGPSPTGRGENDDGGDERHPTPDPSLKGGENGDGGGERRDTAGPSRRPQPVCEGGEKGNDIDGTISPHPRPLSLGGPRERGEGQGQRQGSGGGAEQAGLGVLEGLFGACNPDMTFTEVMRAVWTDVECLGNGYLELTRNSLGQVDGFYHVPGTTVRVLADKSGFVQIREGRKRYFRALGQPEVVDPETGVVANEMMHFSKYTPQSAYYGVPDIIPAVPAVVGDKAARDYNIDFFTHNAVPRMAIIVEGGQLSDSVLGQLKQFMESEIKGQGHKTLVLETPGPEARVRLEKLTVGGSDEAGFLEYRKANRDEVLLVHRVPPSKVTVVENANLANSKDQDKTFREQVVRPEQRRIEYKFNRLIREQMGICGWEFKFKEMDLDEEREQAEVAAIYAGIGVLDAEEIRGRLGM